MARRGAAGFVYSFEENDDFTLAAMKMIKAHAPVFENIVRSHARGAVRFAFDI